MYAVLYLSNTLYVITTMTEEETRRPLLIMTTSILISNPKKCQDHQTLKGKKQKLCPSQLFVAMGMFLSFHHMV